MKFIELKDADDMCVLFNVNQIVAIAPYIGIRDGKEYRGTKLYCTDGDSNPFKLPVDYDTVKKLLEGAEE